MVIVMVSATYYHIVRGESAVVTLILLVMAGFVAYMRHRVLPISPRRRAGQTVSSH
jgi:hypothetical protein